MKKYIAIGAKPELAGKSVNIGVTGCNSQGYPLVYAVGVYQ